ncbi:hypothetical protein EVAR_27901_1 [Eumeta japonica]|uniref:Uncharacterized protein n=1 Tax=Eumeta variegata TaxID=151549 RepID=A0A4C1UVG7_EUMVA|nr:hypothetical protein EVAR_27901_1 [Eumeta japonica]
MTNGGSEIRGHVTPVDARGSPGNIRAKLQETRLISRSTARPTFSSRALKRKYNTIRVDADTKRVAPSPASYKSEPLPVAVSKSIAVGELSRKPRPEPKSKTGLESKSGVGPGLGLRTLSRSKSGTIPGQELKQERESDRKVVQYKR